MMTTNVGNILTLHKSLFFFPESRGHRSQISLGGKKKKSEKFGSEVPKEEMISEKPF